VVCLLIVGSVSVLVSPEYDLPNARPELRAAHSSAPIVTLRFAVVVLPLILAHSCLLLLASCPGQQHAASADLIDFTCVRLC
jgi:hypothetical protein